MRAWRALVGARLRALAARPGDLAAGFLGDLVVVASGLLVVAALVARTGSVGGFDPRVVAVAWGLAQGATGLAASAFGGLFVFNRRYLLDGDLDRVLTRPLDAFGQVMVEHLDPAALVRAAVGLAVAAWGAAGLGVPLGVGTVGAIAAWTLGGALLVAGVLSAAASVGFVARHEGSAVGLVAQFQGLAHVPLPVLPAPFAVIALTVLPFALTGFVPAAALVGEPGWAVLAALQPAIGVGAFAAGRWIFGRGIARHGAGPSD